MISFDFGYLIIFFVDRVRCRAVLLLLLLLLL